MINKKTKLNKGMTYIELIVVLSIFAVLSTVVMFNYNDFQSKVDLKNLASDIALQIVQAQKSSLSGLLPLPTQSHSATWKPSYGVYFNINGIVGGADSKDFIYFTDLDSSNSFDGSTCPTATGECLSKYTITKNNSISALTLVNGAGCPAITNLTIVFTRLNSGAIITSTTPIACTFSYVQITIHPPKGLDAYIRLYPSGRVEID